MEMRICCTLGACLVVAACAGLPTTGATTYRCGDGKSMTARYGLGQAVVRLDDAPRELRLPSVKSFSGDKYSDGKTTLWVRGREAYLERAGQAGYFGCRAQR
jgi:membrane-bound inhibitor of C-type lysozyme